MRRWYGIVMSLLLVAGLICGCKPSPEAQETPPLLEVRVGEVKAGMRVGEIPVSASYAGKSVECYAEWVEYLTDDYRIMDADDRIPENYWGKVDVYSVLPLGVDVYTLDVAVEAPGGRDDGTGHGDTRDNGAMVAFTHIQYGQEPAKPPANVTITVGTILPGYTVKNVPVSVTLDGKEIFCNAEWIQYLEDDYRYLEPEEAFPTEYYGRLDVQYLVPHSYDWQNGETSLASAQGELDGAGGDLGAKDDAELLWAHVQFDFRTSATASQLMTPTPQETPEALRKSADITIRIGEIREGARVDSVPVTVLLDGKELPNETEWVVYFEDGYDDLKAEDPFPDQYWGKVDVHYNVPKGYRGEDPRVTLDCAQGSLDGTGDYGLNEDGSRHLWTHVQFDLRKTETVTPQPAATPAAHQHHWVEDTSKSKAPGCTEAGYRYIVCPDCGQHYQESIPAIGSHDYDLEHPTRIEQATCDKGGYRLIACRRCGETYQEDTPALGHNMNPVSWISGNCEEGSLWKCKCSRCGLEEERQFGPMEHKWDDAEYYSGQFHEFTCVFCGETKLERHSFDPGSSQCKICGSYVIN